MEISLNGNKPTALNVVYRTPRTTQTLTLEDMISDENTGIGRVRAEVDTQSNEFLETLSAMACSVRYEQVLAESKLISSFDLDLFAARMYLAGRFDQRGAPAPLPVTN